MSLPVPQQAGALLEQVLIGGDLSRLKPEDKVMYYKSVCESMGLNPLTKPFEYIKLNGREVLYALRSCTEQLRKIHGVSVIISSREEAEGCYIVTARATDKTGRHDESIGAVPIKGLIGEARSNAMMKAETKAKRRVTLAICGLGMLDESEADSIPGAYPSPVTPTAGYLAELPAPKQEVMHETAAEIKALWANDQASDAYALIENSGFSAEEMIALWSLLPSDIRSAHKRMKAQETATEKGVISPAKHKRIEAIIKEHKLDRNGLKNWCLGQFGVDSFPKLNDEQYKLLDDHIALMMGATTNAAVQSSTATNETAPSKEGGGQGEIAQSATISEQQESAILDLLEANGVSLKEFIEKAAIKKILDLRADRFEGAVAWVKKQKGAK